MVPRLGSCGRRVALGSATLCHPNCRAVRFLWQFAQTTSHLSISLISEANVAINYVRMYFVGSTAHATPSAPLLIAVAPYPDVHVLHWRPATPLLCATRLRYRPSHRSIPWTRMERVTREPGGDGGRGGAGWTGAPVSD